MMRVEEGEVGLRAWSRGDLCTPGAARESVVFSGDSSQATSIFHWRNTQPRQAGWTQSPIWSRWAVHTWRVPRPLQHPTRRLSKPHPAPTQSAPAPPLPFGRAGSRRQCPGLAGLAQEGLRPHPTQLSTLQLSLPLQAHHLAGVANSHPSPVQQARLKLPQKLCLSWGWEQPGKQGGGCFHQPRFQMLLASAPPLLPRLLAGHGHCHDRALANPGRRGWVARCLFLFLTRRSLKPRIATITLKGHFQPRQGLSKFYST